MILNALERAELLNTVRVNPLHNAVSEEEAIKAYSKLASGLNTLQWGLCVIFLTIGMVATPITFDTSTGQKLNIFWLLGVLLGTHFLSLLLWCIGLLTSRNRQHYSASLTSSITSAVAKRLNVPLLIFDAFIKLRVSGQRAKWLGARLLHSVWASYLLGGLVSALVFLMTHQVQFVWETTLLTSTNFATLTQVLSIIPDFIGIPTPSLSDIQQSQVDQLGQSEPLRQMWAIWLLSCIVIYGVFIRSGLVLLSHFNYHRSVKKFLKNSLPAMPPRNTVRQVIDPDRADLSTVTNSKPLHHLERVGSITESERCYLFEWSQPIPNALQGRNVQTINSAEEQERFAGAHETSAVIINVETSPDRGSRRFFQRTVGTSSTYYLVGESFLKEWQQTLLEAGIQSKQIKILEGLH